MSNEPIQADVVCESVGHAVLELQRLAKEGGAFFVHIGSHSYCSESHEHFVMALPFRVKVKKDGCEFSIGSTEALVDAIVDERELPLLEELRKPIPCPGVNNACERVERLSTKIDGLWINVRQWAAVSNFNGGYDIGGTDYKFLIA